MSAIRALFPFENKQKAVSMSLGTLIPRYKEVEKRGLH